MKNKKFRNVYLNLPRADRTNIKTREKIMSQCKVTKTTFYFWLNGTSPVPPLAKPIIAKIMKMKQSELFPEFQTV